MTKLYQLPLIYAIKIFDFYRQKTDCARYEKRRIRQDIVIEDMRVGLYLFNFSKLYYRCKIRIYCKQSLRSLLKKYDKKNHNIIIDDDLLTYIHQFDSIFLDSIQSDGNIFQLMMLIQRFLIMFQSSFLQGFD